MVQFVQLILFSLLSNLSLNLLHFSQWQVRLEAYETTILNKDEFSWIGTTVYDWFSMFDHRNLLIVVPDTLRPAAHNKKSLKYDKF